MLPKTILIKVFLSLGFLANPAKCLTQVNNDKAIITAISEARANAFNQGDAEGISKFFTDNAILMAPGEPVAVGKEAVRKYYQNIFDEFMVELESHYEEVDVSGNMAYGRGEAIVKATPINGGKTTVTSSKYLNILKRQPNGDWLTTHDIWNSNALKQ